MALWTGRPLARSHRIAVSRWLVIPSAATPLTPTPARASASRQTATESAQMCSGSCSTQPSAGKNCCSSRCALATMRPSASNRIARVLVVPWSRARMCRAMPPPLRTDAGWMPDAGTRGKEAGSELRHLADEDLGGAVGVVRDERRGLGREGDPVVVALDAGRADRDPDRRPGRAVAHEDVGGADLVTGGEVGGGRLERDHGAVSRDRGPVALAVALRTCGAGAHEPGLPAGSAAGAAAATDRPGRGRARSGLLAQAGRGARPQGTEGAGSLRTKMSAARLLSPETSVAASESKATQRPSSEIEGRLPAPPFRAKPPFARALASAVLPVSRSWARASYERFVSPGRMLIA